MKHVPASVFILITFVSVYIFCVSTYTFVAALHNVNLWIKKEDVQEDTNDFSRLKREENFFANLLSSDSWRNNITFNICCNRDELLNSKFECVKSGDIRVSDSDSFSKKAEFLSQVTIVDGNLTTNSINPSRITFKYNSGGNCTPDEVIVLSWPPSELYSYYISQEDGHILEMSEDRGSVIFKFSTSSYCLNQMMEPDGAKRYVALLCPCKEKVCIQKCCDKGYYYNVKANKCEEEEEEHIKSYIPTFYDKDVKINTNVPYNLMHKGPNCSGPDKLLEDGFKSLPLYIQRDGQLMVILNHDNIEIFVDRGQYCVDVFSDGSANSSYINGFYCQNAITSNIVTMEEIKGKYIDLDTPLIKALRSADVHFLANPTVVMVLSVLLFIM